MKPHVCIIGSGAGAAPIAYTLSEAGIQVTILEKGPFLQEADFSKDEILACRKSVYTPNLKDEQHVLETKNSQGEWVAKNTFDSGRDFWNGNMVGGSSNLMSGYFHRLKPNDFKLLSTYGPIEGANVADWPISYEDLEPYYAKVEQLVGVSGKVVNHAYLEPRSTPDFPYPPLRENIIAQKIDAASKVLGYSPLPTPRAIISESKNNRNSCYYSNYCGSYGCSSGAKGSARAALLQPALANGNLTIIPSAKVYKLQSNTNGDITSAH
jgi:choline dehydrogenase-like flavoprotein